MKLIFVSNEKALYVGPALWLDQQPDMEVIGTFDTRTAMDSLVTLEGTQPDFLLIECTWTDASVLELLSQLQKLEKQPRTIVLATRAGSKQIALDAGADAFVQAGDGTKKLLTTIRSLNLGMNYAV